jgi:hypothetical protein
MGKSGRRRPPRDGIVALLGACVFWSLGSIYTRHAKHGADPFMAAALQMLGGGGALLILALFHGDFADFIASAITIARLARIRLPGLDRITRRLLHVRLADASQPPRARVATYGYVNPVVGRHSRLADRR